MPFQIQAARLNLHRKGSTHTTTSYRLVQSFYSDGWWREALLLLTSQPVQQPTLLRSAVTDQQVWVYIGPRGGGQGCSHDDGRQNSGWWWPLLVCHAAADTWTAGRDAIQAVA
jgi:hypothetical protein